MPASTAREALIVEAIGDVAALLDRLEALGPTIDASRQAAVEASVQLSATLEVVQGHIATVSDTARTQVVQYIAQRTQEAAQHAQEVQSRAIAQAAQQVFRGEVERAVQHLAGAMQAVNAADPPLWQAWLTYAATAVTASAATCLLVAWSQIR